MNRLMALAASTIALAAGLLFTSPATASAAGCSRPTVLPSISPIWHHNRVTGLGGHGRIAVGESDDLPVYWQDGVIKRVPLPAGVFRGQVNAVNEFGLMVGWMTGALSDPDHLAVAFRYWPGKARVELYPRGSEATDINNAGYATVNFSSDYAFVYGPGVRLARTLRIPQYGSLSGVTGLNDAGRAVGSVDIPEDGRARSHSSAVTWAADGSMAELKPTGESSPRIGRSASGIDNRGRVIGETYDYRQPDAANNHGLFWPSIKMAGQPVPMLSLDAISPSTQVVVGIHQGTTSGGGDEGWEAAMWRGSGPVTILPALSPQAPSFASAVDDDGRVGGVAVDAQGKAQPVIWKC